MLIYISFYFRFCFIYQWVAFLKLMNFFVKLIFRQLLLHLFPFCLCHIRLCQTHRCLDFLLGHVNQNSNRQSCSYLRNDLVRYARQEFLQNFWQEDECFNWLHLYSLILLKANLYLLPLHQHQKLIFSHLRLLENHLQVDFIQPSTN
jgi:hypothetical protein